MYNARIRRTYLVGFGHLENVVTMWEVHIPLGYVLQGRLVPGDVHVLPAHLPVDPLNSLPLLGRDVDV